MLDELIFRAALEDLAGTDVEELVAIKSRGLSSGYRYLDIAEIWTKARQPDQALAWAERNFIKLLDGVERSAAE